MRARPLYFVLVAVLTLGALCPAAYPDSWVTQTGSHILSSDPYVLDVEFTVRNGGPGWLTNFQLFPLGGPTDSCAVQASAAPVDWVSVLHPTYKGADFYFQQNELVIGGEAGPFHIQIGAVVCGFGVRYFQSGLPEWYREDSVNLGLDVVPAFTSTWGTIKARYR